MKICWQNYSRKIWRKNSIFSVFIFCTLFQGTCPSFFYLSIFLSIYSIYFRISIFLVSIHIFRREFRGGRAQLCMFISTNVHSSVRRYPLHIVQFSYICIQVYLFIHLSINIFHTQLCYDLWHHHIWEFCAVSSRPHILSTGCLRVFFPENYSLLCFAIPPPSNTRPGGGEERQWIVTKCTIFKEQPVGDPRPSCC